MSSNEIMPSRPATPTRIGQATAVEQSRAVAEVQAAVLVAQQCPRDVQEAIKNMRISCGMYRLAERAFYRYKRGGQSVSDMTVHLARELARVWGNIDYGIRELSRDDHHGQSEMLAYAWDQQTNVRDSIAVIVPHGRDKDGGIEKITSLRDIYENNANNAARRLRQCIVAQLPPWFVDEAKELCRETLKRGADAGQKAKPLPTRIADMLRVFATQRVTEDDLARKLGRPSSKWTEWDLGDLGVIYKSLERGEVSRDDEFPPPTLTSEEIAAARPDTAPAATAPTPPPPADPAPTRPRISHEWDSVEQFEAAQPVESLAEIYTEPDTEKAPAELANKVKHGLYEIGITKPRDQVDVLGQIARRKFARLTDVTTDACARANDMLVIARQAGKDPIDQLRAFEQQLGELSESDGGA